VRLHYHETRSGQPEATVVLSATTEPKGEPEAKHEVGEPNGNRHASGGTREGITISILLPPHTPVTAGSRAREERER
jgi:hypothetical protein